ncbi:flagellin N-terminal helical domain-containing protein [Bosea sp. (in: a-proteobacteria)]
MAISLSANVRNNLTSLQSITAQAAAVQNRLATGKKVNTAVDNPVNYFTAQSLNSRSDALKGLLDGMSNGIQTIQAASKGIDGITKLVNSMQSTIKQAQSDAAQNRPTATGTALATTAEKIATSKSLKDIVLDKAIVGKDLVDNADPANPTPAPDGVADNDEATASNAGNLGLVAGDEGTMLAISIKAGDNEYTAAFDAKNMTVRDIVNEINKSGIATAFVDEKGQFNVKGTGSETLQFGFGKVDVTAVAAGAPTAEEIATAKEDAIARAGSATNDNAALNLAADGYDVGTSASNVTSAVRSNLIQQFNDLRTQIDELAKDASFNGINLLAGDQLSIAFNEKTGANQSKMNIQGSVVTAENLGISQAVNTQTDGLFNFQNDNDLGKATDALNSALTSLKSLSSTFGAQLSVANTRQDFTKGLADTLTVGADNLVNADANEEAANLLSLQTRQQLSQTALSLASQSDQAVLRLF